MARCANRKNTDQEDPLCVEPARADDGTADRSEGQSGGRDHHQTLRKCSSEAESHVMGGGRAAARTQIANSASDELDPELVEEKESRGWYPTGREAAKGHSEFIGSFASDCICEARDRDLPA